MSRRIVHITSLFNEFMRAFRLLKNSSNCCKTIKEQKVTSSNLILEGHIRDLKPLDNLPNHGFKLLLTAKTGVIMLKKLLT